MVHYYCKSHYAQGSRNSIHMERNPYTNWNDRIFYNIEHQKIQNQIRIKVTLTGVEK